jgi:hypothetical protein
VKNKQMKIGEANKLKKVALLINKNAISKLANPLSINAFPSSALLIPFILCK